jgi:hypothetical protein
VFCNPGQLGRNNFRLWTRRWRPPAFIFSSDGCTHIAIPKQRILRIHSWSDSVPPRACWHIRHTGWACSLVVLGNSQTFGMGTASGDQRLDVRTLDAKNQGLDCHVIVAGSQVTEKELSPDFAS